MDADALAAPFGTSMHLNDCKMGTLFMRRQYAEVRYESGMRRFYWGHDGGTL